jgi:hypothetical protein
VVTLMSPNGGASIEGAATFNITIGNDDSGQSGGGGGGGVIGGDLLLLLALFGLARRKSLLTAGKHK